MTIDVSDLIREVGARLELDVRADVPPVEYGGAVVAFEPVRCRLILVHTGGRILVEGGLSGAARLVCSRCLEAYRHPLQTALALEYRAAPAAEAGTAAGATGTPGPAGGNAEGPADDEVGRYAHGRLDLGDAVREALLLALPMKPLCRPDCPGLCPRCGHRLAEGPCGCPAEEPDPKWAPLLRYRVPERTD